MKNSIELDCQFESLSVLEAWVESLGKTYSLHVDLSSAILVAVTEAFTNAVRHDNAEGKMIKISYLISEKNVLIGVRQNGKNIPKSVIERPELPFEIENPDGRGIFIISRLTKSIKISEDGKELILTFDLKLR